MDNKKPSEIIAARFNISGESAKYFLGSVQKSFRKVKPPQGLIVDFMSEQKFKFIPAPHQVATLMKQAGIWDQPLNAAPPALEDEPDIY